MTATTVEPQDVVTFWQQAEPQKWFEKNQDFDKDIIDKFQSVWELAEQGKLEHWKDSSTGLLALILVMDQFPRNMFRNSAKAFSTDKQAREIATLAVEKQADQDFDVKMRAFFYLPFEHSEDLADQQKSMDLFEALGDDLYLRYAQTHFDIIEKFGRFPHRNTVLNRKTTSEEQVFLDAGGFAG